MILNIGLAGASHDISNFIFIETERDASPALDPPRVKRTSECACWAFHFPSSDCGNGFNSSDDANALSFRRRMNMNFGLP